MQFPALLSANLFRGAFGSLLRESVCHPPCDDVRQCPRQADCPYAQIFRPFNSRNPSGLADAPRPFIFRTRHLDGNSVLRGDDFYIDIHFFTRDNQIVDHFRQILSQFEIAGFGPSRRRAILTSVDEQPAPYLPLDAAQVDIASLKVQFHSPTELKHRGSITREPNFSALWNNVCHRINALNMLYSHQPIDADFAGLSKAAQHVRLVQHELRHRTKSRRSSRTGQLHPLGGFVGGASYEGALGAFVPYLQVAQWTGVGRQTVWGKGEIAVSLPSPSATTSREQQ